MQHQISSFHLKHFKPKTDIPVIINSIPVFESKKMRAFHMIFKISWIWIYLPLIFLMLAMIAIFNETDIFIMKVKTKIWIDILSKRIHWLILTWIIWTRENTKLCRYQQKVKTKVCIPYWKEFKTFQKSCPESKQKHFFNIIPFKMSQCILMFPCILQYTLFKFGCFHNRKSCNIKKLKDYQIYYFLKMQESMESPVNARIFVTNSTRNTLSYEHRAYKHIGSEINFRIKLFQKWGLPDAHFSPKLKKEKRK